MNQIYHPGTFWEQRRYRMAEIFDEYADQFLVTAQPYGVSLTFRKSSATPPTPGNVPAAEEIGVIRMSLEHFKVMSFLMKRQMDEIEGQLGYPIKIPSQLMHALKIAPEDWETFWKHS